MKVKNLFLIVWFGMYIVYPSWLLPVSVPARVVIYVLYISYFSLNGYLLHRWTVRGPEDRLHIPSLKDVRLGVRSNPLLLGVLVVAAALHIYPMTLPITNCGDEGVHSLYSLLILRDFSRYTERVLAIDAQSFVRIVILLSMLGFVLRAWYSRNRRSMEKCAKNIMGGMATVVFLIGYFYLLRNQEYQIGLLRFPPLGKILSLISYSLFGISEFTARLPSLVFYILSGVAMYKLIRLYQSRIAATLGTALLLFLPGYFFYSSLAYLEAGAVFFIVLSSYYFLRHIQTADRTDFLLSMFSLGLGFMQRRMLAPMFGVIWIYLIVAKARMGMSGRRPRGKRRNQMGRHVRTEILDWGSYLKYSWLGLVPIIPWLVIGKLYVWRHYQFTPSHWLSYQIVTSYLRNMPGQITYPLFVIFIFGSLWGLLRRRNDLTIYSLVLFAVYYIFFTSDRTIGNRRFMTALLPSVAIISVLALYDPIQRLGRKKVYGLWAVILGCLVVSLPINPVATRSEYSTDYYFSYDKILERIQVAQGLPPRIPASARTGAGHRLPVKEAPDQDKKLVHIRPLDSAVEFYLIKSGARYETLDVGVVSTPEQLREYCRRHGCGYILFSYANHVGDERIGVSSVPLENGIVELTEALCMEDSKMYSTIVSLDRKQTNETIVLGEVN